MQQQRSTKGAIYRYPRAGIALSRWERLTLCSLQILVGLSAALPDFALLLLTIKAFSMPWFPSALMSASAICSVPACG